jgi:transposase
MLAPNPVAGIDVGKSFLDLGFDSAARPLRAGNDAAGIAALIAALRRRGTTPSRSRRTAPTLGR